jgi:CubicO group peptidase (beta-lactamase class C family)
METFNRRIHIPITMKTLRSFSLIMLFFCIFTACTKNQLVSNILPQSTPEAEGVSSTAIITFLDSAAKSNSELHGFVFLRHGKIIASGWWNPYQPDLKHTLYSTSKSFTSTAVGFAVSEKLLTVEDKVISFFPNDLPDTVSPFLADLRVKDLLSMSAGMDPDPTFAVVGKDSNWIKAFLSTPIINKPGTKFLYNTLATYTLSAIVQKVTGEKIINYLTPRLFTPLGIEGMDWEQDLMGINTGGWGLRLKTEDMAKFGQLYLQKGKWNGKQIIPAEWIEEATTSKIDQAPDMPRAKKDSSDWTQGYCYQMWRCRHNAFRADGAYGQFIIVMPDEDAVIAINAETPDMQDEINLVWSYLLPGIQTGKLEENAQATADLKQKLSSLALPNLANGKDSALAGEISGKTFILAPNPKNLESLTFSFSNNECHVTEITNKSTYEITFGSGTWRTGETNKPGPSLLEGAHTNTAFLYPAKIAASYTWIDKNTLELVLRYIESPHSETLICRFDHNKLEADLMKSQDYGKQKVTLTGTIKK